MQTAVMLPDPSLRAYIHHYWVMKADRISVEMNKEFKYFAGMTPTQYMRHLLEIERSNFIKGYFAYHTE